LTPLPCAMGRLISSTSITKFISELVVLPESGSYVCHVASEMVLCF